MTHNASLYLPTKSMNSGKPLGKFHQFNEALQEAIILTAMTDAPATQT
jgi:hypothetical protein